MSTPVRVVYDALSRLWTRGGRVDRTALLVAGALFASGLLHVAVLVWTGGPWTGPLSLRKPATFGLSFGLTLATVVWATTLVRIRPGLRAFLLCLFTAACVVETVLVATQAWRGVPSHFNFETPVDTAVTGTLAAGGIVIMAAVLTFTAAVLSRGATASPSTRIAVRFGFLALLLSMATGAVMIATGVAEVRTGDPEVAYTTAGALKPLHGAAMHAVLVVPGIAWLLSRSKTQERTRLRSVWAAVAAYTVLLAAAGYVSFAAGPVLDAPPFVVAAAAGALSGLAAVGATALYRLRGTGRAQDDGGEGGVRNSSAASR